MNLEEFIHVETNVISHNFCKQIIEEYNDPNDWKPGTINDYEVNEYLESINDDFIPRRSAQPYLRAVYPAGFEVSKHRNLGVKYSLNEIDSTLYNSIGSSSSHVIKGRPPPGFSFVKWAQGGPENIIEDEIDDEEDADPYSGVAGTFRKVKPRRNKLFKCFRFQQEQ